jgi:hypothetical protein
VLVTEAISLYNCVYLYLKQPKKIEARGREK